MKKTDKDIKVEEEQITRAEFLKSFNQNMPTGFPKVTDEQLLRFKDEHVTFFKHGEYWSLDQHRKKIIDWLQQNRNLVEPVKG